MIALAWIIALVVLAAGMRGQRHQITVPLSALAVSLIALLHSSIDFSLQIAGYSIVAFALLGLGLARAVLAWERGDAHPKTRAECVTPTATGFDSDLGFPNR
jgi:hypothetical protein